MISPKIWPDSTKDEIRASEMGI